MQRFLLGRARQTHRVLVDSRHFLSLRTFESIPGPSRLLLLLNHIYPLKRLDTSDVPELYARLQKTYGNIVKFGDGFSKPEVFVFSPESVRKVFTSTADKYPTRKPIEPMNSYYRMRGRPFSLASSDGAEWRHMRTLVNQVMTRPACLHAYVEEEGHIIDTFIKFVIESKYDAQQQQQQKQVVVDNLQLDLRHLSLELITLVTFQKNVKALSSEHREASVDRLFHVLDLWMAKTSEIWFDSSPMRYLPSRRWLRYLKLSDEFFGIIDTLTDLACARHALTNNESQKKTVIGHLLASQGEHNMNMNHIRSIMAELVFGGIDTMAASLHFCLYELGTNLNIQEELYADIAPLFDQHSNYVEIWQKSSLLRACVREVYRLWPVSSILGRRLKEDMTLDGYSVPKGTFINVVPHVTGRMESLFSEPNRFNPHRWIERNNERARDSSYFASIPFGFGPRGCIGKQLILKYRMKYEGEPFQLKSTFNLAPNKPLRMSFERR